MVRNALMATYPASQEAQVTLANWMTKPFNQWSFRNVRQILPTATVRRSGGPVAVQFALGSLDDVQVEGFVIEDELSAAAIIDRLAQMDRTAIRKRFEERFTARRMALDYLAAYQELTDAAVPRMRLVSSAE